MRHPTVLLCLGILVAAISGTYIVLSNSPGEEVGNSLVSVETTDYPFRLMMALEKTVYNWGEPVNITISLTNISDEKVTISLLAGGLPCHQFDFLVYDWFNNLIYRYSAYRGYYQGGYTLTLAPNQSFTGTFIWKQIKNGENENDGGAVAKGTYYIAGKTYQIFNHLHQSVNLETPRLKITIK
jgi:hypothetical protein